MFYYNYKIRSKLCNYSIDSDIIPVTISQTIDKPTWVTDQTLSQELQSNLFASKGDYKNRVELSWNNENNALISTFEIERRLVIDNEFQTSNFIKIAETSSNVHHFIDYNVEGNVLYEYRIIAKIPDCNTGGQSSDQYIYHISNETIGFRTPFSSVHGQITYDEIGVVENVEVFATSTNPMSNKSLIMDSISNNFTFSGLNGSFSFMGWLKPDFTNLNTSFNILSISDDVSKNLILGVDSSLQINNINSVKLNEGWNQISLTYDNLSNTLSVFLNGNKVIYTNIDYSNVSSITLFNNFKGFVDEFSVWKKSLQEQFIISNFDKFLQRKNPDILAYFHCDEGISNFIYDCSIDEQDIFNHNHIQLGNFQITSVLIALLMKC